MTVDRDTWALRLDCRARDPAWAPARAPCRLATSFSNRTIYGAQMKINDIKMRVSKILFSIAASFEQLFCSMDLKTLKARAI